jgi:hypothetical protein
MAQLNCKYIPKMYCNKIKQFCNTYPTTKYMVAAAAGVVVVVVVVVIVVVVVVVVVVAVVVVVVVNKSAHALMPTSNQAMRSLNYGPNTNKCDQFFMFFISPHRQMLLLYFTDFPLSPLEPKIDYKP